MEHCLVDVAQNQIPAQLILRNAKIVDVFTGSIYPADIAIANGKIAGIGHYETGETVIDLQGRYASPGLINAHCHVESSMAAPGYYCMEELRWGVTTLITDPHEIANVAGTAGIRYMLDATRDLPINYYVQMPSCVPATPFEHAGCVLDAEQMREIADEPGVLGLGEVMNVPGVLSHDQAVCEKLDLFAGRPIDGHAPGLTGEALQAYAPMGLSPRKVNGYIKGELRKRGIQVPRNMEPHAREFVDERKTPTDRLVARLGLSAYYGLHAHTCIPLEPETVFIPFQQHIGKPAVPVKAVGDPVAKGELLAQAAPDGLSANIHASIDGVVTEITPAGARLCRKEV